VDSSATRAATNVDSREVRAETSANSPEALEQTVVRVPPPRQATVARQPEVSASDGASDLIPTGTSIGYWTITRKLGEGGMGAVYAATAADIGTTVAVKVLSFPDWRKPGAQTQFEKAKERFRREAEAASRLKHPNVIAILAYGSLPDGRPYFVMEYLPGRPLDVRLREDPPQGAELVRLLSQVCDALAAIHMEGIVHRDLKPENIWIVEPKQGETFAKLLDFGISKMEGTSKLTETGTHAGTVYYESPEQLDGKNIGPRSDVYAFGAVLYEVFTGQLLFGEQSLAKIFHDILFADPPPLVPRPPYTISPALDRLILDCLKKKPDERPQSASELKARLQSALTESAPALAIAPAPRQEARLVSAPGPAVKPEHGLATSELVASVSGRRKVVSKMLVGVLVLALAAALFAGLRGSSNRQEPTAAPAKPMEPAKPLASPEPPRVAPAPSLVPGEIDKGSVDRRPTRETGNHGQPTIRRAIVQPTVSETHPRAQPESAGAETALAPPPAADLPPPSPVSTSTSTTSSPPTQPNHPLRGPHRPLLPQKPQLIYKDLRTDP
jgi:tRNA A-37 threonylcarbamoyl transferase component Bud32